MKQGSFSAPKSSEYTMRFCKFIYKAAFNLYRYMYKSMHHEKEHFAEQVGRLHENVAFISFSFQSGLLLI